MPTAAHLRRTHEGDASAPVPSFSCSLTSSGRGTAYVRPGGELDLATAPQLDQALVSALKGARLVVLDLSELDFLDSCGVHVIAAATSAARTVGRRMVTLRGPDHVHDIFALTDSENDVDLHEHDGSTLSEVASLEGASDAYRLSA
jgi:anti-anti-sigma factor